MRTPVETYQALGICIEYLYSKQGHVNIMSSALLLRRLYAAFFACVFVFLTSLYKCQALFGQDEYKQCRCTHLCLG